MRNNIVKKLLLAATAVAATVVAGADAPRVEAAVVDRDHVMLGGWVCEFAGDPFHGAVAWGDNAGGDPWIRVRGLLIFNSLVPGSCQLRIRYYDGSGNRVGTSSPTITKYDLFSRYRPVLEDLTRTSIRSVQLCTRSRFPGGPWGHDQCVTRVR